MYSWRASVMAVPHNVQEYCKKQEGGVERGKEGGRERRENISLG